MGVSKVALAAEHCLYTRCLRVCLSSLLWPDALDLDAVSYALSGAYEKRTFAYAPSPLQ
jgi:hypothetical protein